MPVWSRIHGGGGPIKGYGSRQGPRGQQDRIARGHQCPISARRQRDRLGHRSRESWHGGRQDGAGRTARIPPWTSLAARSRNPSIEATDMATILNFDREFQLWYYTV